jgi:hypothetical protein
MTPHGITGLERVKSRDNFTVWGNADMDRYTNPSFLLLVLKQTNDMKLILITH